MNTTPSSGNLLLGKGSLFFDRINPKTGLPTGERHLGNCPTFTFTSSGETLDLYSSMDHDASLYKSVVKQVTGTGKIELNEYDPINLATVLLGDSQSISQTAGSIAPASPESITVHKNCLYKLGGFTTPNSQKFNILKSSIVLSKGATALIEDQDYIVVNALAGVIMFPDNLNTTLVEGDTVTLSYNYNSALLRRIFGGTSTQVEGYLRFIGDPTTGPRYDAEFWHIVVKPEGDVNFIGDDWGKFSLSFECLDDSMNHASRPFYYIVKN